MPAPLRLTTFGDLVLERVREDGSVETVYRSGKLLALLLHLTIRREVPQRRTELADLFWGDEAPEKARASLRQAIASLHRLLGESALLATRETVQIVEACVVSDRERFLDAVHRGDAMAVVALYRGPFLATEPRAGEGFERWVSSERLRFRQEFLRLVEVAVSDAVRAGDPTRAIELARAVRVAEPEEAEGVRLLFDALVAGGRRSDARRVIEEFADQIGRTDDGLPPALGQRLARVRAEQDPARGEGRRPLDAAALSGLGTELVGRDAILNELIAAAEQARLGTPRPVVLVGPSGSGKTRVLDELEARLRLRGARTVRVRLFPAMRAVPFSGLAEICRALAVLPGAMGVGASSAATLVEFLPELRAQFRAAEGRPIGEPDRLRLRREALLDLIAAVAERRSVSCLIDDAQHLDVASLTAIRAISQLREVRWMLLLASWSPLVEGTDGFAVLDLPPLSSDGVRGMVESVATWPTGRAGEAVLDELTRVARGLPQVVLQIVRTLQGEGSLRLEEGAWRIADLDRLLERIGAIRPASIALDRLPATQRLFLRILSVWGRPIPDAALRAIARSAEVTLSEGECGEALEVLESLGLVVARASAWTIAHDTIADALREEDSAEARQVVRERVVRWWVAQPGVDLPILEHLVLLCAERDDLPLARSAVAALTRGASWRRTQRLSAVRLANRLAFAVGRPEWEAPLYDSMGWVARRSRVELAWYSAAATAVVVGFGALVTLLWPRLRVEVDPLGEVFMDQRIGTLQVQPRVGVYDGFGRRLRLDGTVRAVAEGSTRLIGDTVIPLRDGRAQFRKLALTSLEPDPEQQGSSPVPQRIRFSGPGWILGTTATVHGMVGVTQEGVRIVEGTVNGQPIDSTLRVRLPRGARLAFELTIEYTTSGTTQNYVVGAGPTWLDPATSVIRLAGLPRPVIGAWQTVQFEVPPAERAGHQHLIILFRAEDSVQHLFSATNWSVGAPVWDDGNDIVSTLTEAKIDTLRRSGVVSIDRYLLARYEGRQAQIAVGGIRIERAGGLSGPTYATAPLMGTAIEIDFYEPTTGR